MRKVAGVLGVVVCISCLPARSDTVCPSGAGISDILGAWAKYSTASDPYIKRLHRRVMSQVGKIAGAASARNDRGLYSASRTLGEIVDTHMQRMWEEGFIAASDLVAAYCMKTPAKSEWSAAIREKRERAYCKTEPNAHFCPKR